MNRRQDRRSGGGRTYDARGSRDVRVSVSNTPEVDQSHTIVLYQPSDFESRTYIDYETLPQALEGILKLYEQELKRLRPRERNITYDIKDLYKYIDESITDLSCLVFTPQIAAYKPYSKDWIKQNLLAHLKMLAQQQ